MDGAMSKDAMSQYVCMVFDAAGAILRVEPLDAANDIGAGNQGILLQLTTRTAAAFEVWRGAVKVACFYGRKSAWSSRVRSGEKSLPTHTQSPLFGVAPTSVSRRTSALQT